MTHILFTIYRIFHNNSTKFIEMNNKHSATENISFMPNLNISFNMNKGLFQEQHDTMASNLSTLEEKYKLCTFSKYAKLQNVASFTPFPNTTGNFLY